jgi:hypothetical protein
MSKVEDMSLVMPWPEGSRVGAMRAIFSAFRIDHFPYPFVRVGDH